MKDVVYDSLSIEEFECRWIELIRSFNLGENEWLNSLWEERSRCVPAYFGVTYVLRNVNHSKGRKHSSSFKGFMNAKTSLREFVQKDTRAIECHANAEKVATTNDDRRKTKIKSTLMVERFFQKIYTDAKFKEVQTECLALIYVFSGTEHKGILYRHCIRAMETTNIVTVPHKYVLNRWRKDVKRKHLDVKVAFHGPDKTEDELRYGRLQYEYEKIFNLASTSNELCEHAVKNAETQTQLMEQCMNPFYNTLSQTSSLGVPLQFNVHRSPRADFRWAINEQQQSLSIWLVDIVTPLHLVMTTEGSLTAILFAASSAFRPLHPGSFTNWWTYGGGGTLATGSSSPFTPPLCQFGSGSSTMHGVSTASNGQPILLPQPLPRAVTSFLPPRPS
ncbi:Protein FAR1-RELATED SEQUENCE 2 [Bienertia sinuspersici]